MENNNQNNTLGKFKMANVLTRALKPLSKYERTLLWYALASFNEGEENVSFNKRKFMKDMGIEQGVNARENVGIAMRSLVQNTAVLIDEDISPTGYRIARPIINGVDELDNVITLKRHPDLIPLLDGIKKDFTWFYLDQLVKLDGTYAPKIYEFARIRLNQSQQEKVDWVWYIEPSETNRYESLKSWLDLTKIKTYSNFANIERRILLPAIKEINEKCSDCFIEYNSLENIKGLNNKVVAITLHISVSNVITKVDEEKWYKRIYEIDKLNDFEQELISNILDRSFTKEPLYWRVPQKYYIIPSRYDENIPAIKMGLLRFGILSLENSSLKITNKVSYIQKIIDNFFDVFKLTDKDIKKKEKIAYKLYLMAKYALTSKNKFCEKLQIKPREVQKDLFGNPINQKGNLKKEIESIIDADVDKEDIDVNSSWDEL